ncbi:MAG: nucleoid occlusion protein, partial [Solobacterium sp.]|nr:nucleoid occlusion protein [Solobacterium sp.]
MPSILSIFDRKDTNRIVDIPTEKIVPSRYQPR